MRNWFFFLAIVFAGLATRVAHAHDFMGLRPLKWEAGNIPLDLQLNATLPAHVLLLVREGIPIIENLNLEELAAARVHEFAFVCLPLKMRGATGSPVRPIAIA